MAVTDIHENIAERFKRNFERGVSSWTSPWSGTSAGGLPLRANGRHFRGINVLVLWDVALKRRLPSSLWLTPRESAVLGGSPRKGAHSTTLVAVDRVKTGNTECDEPFTQVAFLRAFSVMNIDQLRGLDRLTVLAHPDAGRSPAEIDVRAAEFIAAAEEKLHSPPERGPDLGVSLDIATAEQRVVRKAIRLVDRASQAGPLAPAFVRAASGSFPDIKRELTLRLSTEFLCANLNVSTQGLLKSTFSTREWLTLLEENRRAVFESASYAQKSLDFLRNIAAQ